MTPTSRFRGFASPSTKSAGEFSAVWYWPIMPEKIGGVAFRQVQRAFAINAAPVICIGAGGSGPSSQFVIIPRGRRDRRRCANR